jgi:hypothetical protein
MPVLYLKSFENQAKIMNDKLQPILVIIATVGMIIFNYFAATGILGGVLTNVPSDKYPTHITPAGYAFSDV